MTDTHERFREKKDGRTLTVRRLPCGELEVCIDTKDRILAVVLTEERAGDLVQWLGGAGADDRVAEANRAGQAMGARIGQDLSEERRIAAERCMRERNEAIRERDKWKARALEAEVEPRDTEPPRLDTVTLPVLPTSEADEAIVDALVARRGTPAPEPRYVQELERRLRSLAEEAAEGEHPGVVRKGRVTLEWLEEGTPAPGPSSFGAQCVAEVGAWPDWKKNAADPPVETPEPEPKKPPNPYGLSDHRSSVWHSGMMRAWAAWLDHIEGTPAPEPALPEGWTDCTGSAGFEGKGCRHAASDRLAYLDDDGLIECVGHDDGNVGCPVEVARWLLVDVLDKRGTPAPEPRSAQGLVPDEVRTYPPCSCTFGNRWICVKHCGGHAIPKPGPARLRGTPGSTEPTGQHEFARHGGRRGRTEP